MVRYKKVRPKHRKELSKPESETNIVDEWEFIDIDRDEQKRGLKRRDRRWKNMKLEEIRAKKAEKIAIKMAEKMKPVDPFRQPNEIELAWLRCDYVLWNIMETKAYAFMEHLRTTKPKAYKHLYKIFMSRNMMEHIQYFVDYFASGGITEERIKLSSVIKHYRKFQGEKVTNITIKRKNEEEREL